MQQLKTVIGLMIVSLGGCSETTNSNKLDSDDYNGKQERVEVLIKEIKSFSKIENAEFELFNVNGFSNNRITVPGASSWDYKFVIRVKPTDVDKWTEGMMLMYSHDYNDSWMKMIIRERAVDWRTESQPEIYYEKGDRVVVLVYRNEGIIFKRVVNL